MKDLIGGKLRRMEIRPLTAPPPHTHTSLIVIDFVVSRSFFSQLQDH